MTITNEEVAEAVRGWVAAFTDPARIRAYEPESIGFGSRTLAVRHMATLSEEQFMAVYRRFLDSLVTYQAELTSLDTAVAGDVGLAWGFFVESFQEKGRPPERSTVRFTLTMAKDDSGWKVLLYHRDMQPLDENGRYLRSLTTVGP